MGFSSISAILEKWSLWSLSKSGIPIFLFFFVCSDEEEVDEEERKEEEVVGWVLSLFIPDLTSLEEGLLGF